MVYARGPHDSADLGHIVKEVWFFLHPSYRPNDLVIVKESPFHLTRRGWGEFPVRVQLHFHDSRNKLVDVIHHLKLDRTYTGLQTLGSETVVEVEVESDKKNAESSVAHGSAASAVGLQNGDTGIVIKTEPGSIGSVTPARLLSPSRIKKEPMESPCVTPTSFDVQIKLEPNDLANVTRQASPNVKTKGMSTPKKSSSSEAGWIQFQICGDNVTPSVSSPSPTPRMGSPKPGWTKISDLSSPEEEKSTTMAFTTCTMATGTTSTAAVAGMVISRGSKVPSSPQPALVNSTVVAGNATLGANQQTHLKIVGPSLKVGNTAQNNSASVTPTTTAPAQLVYVKCVDKAGMALLTPKQVQSNCGASLPLNANDILLKVTPPRSSKAQEASTKTTITPASTTAKSAMTLAALPKNTTLVYCSSKVSQQQGAVSPQSTGSKKVTAATSTATSGNMALAKPGQYFIQYPASVMPNMSSTSILRPRFSTNTPVLQSVSVPTVRPGGVAGMQNVILTKPGTGKPALQSILTSPPQVPASAKDPKKTYHRYSCIIAGRLCIREVTAPGQESSHGWADDSHNSPAKLTQ